MQITLTLEVAHKVQGRVPSCY